MKILTSPDFHLQWEDPSRCPVVGDQAPDDLFFYKVDVLRSIFEQESGQQGKKRQF